MSTERFDLTSHMSSNVSVNNIYALSFVLSACSLLYELLIAQELTMISGDMVTWYSLTVGTYLIAMGAGAIVCGALKQFRGWQFLFRVEIILSVIGAFAVILLEFARVELIINNTSIVYGGMPTFVFFVFAFVLIFCVGFFTGMELPLLIDLGNNLAGDRRVTNRVLGCDYMGSLVAGVVFPLYMLPLLQLHTIGFLIAALNLLVAIYILWRFLLYIPDVEKKTLAITGFTAILMIGCFEGRAIEQFFLKKYYYTNILVEEQISLLDPMKDTPTIFRKSSPYQKIDIVQYPNIDIRFLDAYSTKLDLNKLMPRDYALFLNGDFQFFSNDEELYHEWLAHVPIIINGKVPKRILILGGGDGLLHRELIKYHGVESITHVDIDRDLVTLAKTHPVLTAINQHAFDDPRVHTFFGDAFQYLRQYQGEPYDAIYMDFPDVKDYNLAKLYSREFFYFAKMRLKNDGFLALDTPDVYYGTPLGTTGLLNKHRGDWPILSNTMRLAGFNTIIPFYTILETDNRKAYERLSGLHHVERLQYLINFSKSMHTGFMLLRKDERYGPFKYIDFGVRLHLLNEKRFQLSYPEAHKLMGPVDFSQINSILRPTLPNGRRWVIRKLIPSKLNNVSLVEEKYE